MDSIKNASYNQDTRGSNLFDPVWEVDWIHFFNEDINAILFGSPSIDEVDAMAKDCLTKIKNMQKEIEIGNDLELEFLGLCMQLDRLYWRVSKKEHEMDISRYKSKNTPYFVAKNVLFSNWFKMRKDAVFYVASEFSKYGYADSDTIEYVKSVMRIHTGNDVYEERQKGLAHWLKMGKIRIPNDKFDELQAKIKEFKRFNDALKEIQEYNKKADFYDKILRSYSIDYTKDLQLIALLEDIFVTRIKKSSPLDGVKDLLSGNAEKIANRILARLGKSSDSSVDQLSSTPSLISEQSTSLLTTKEQLDGKTLLKRIQ